MAIGQDRNQAICPAQTGREGIETEVLQHVQASPFQAMVGSYDSHGETAGSRAYKSGSGNRMDETQEHSGN